MDIISPKAIWRDYDRNELELNVSVISDERRSNLRVLSVYFNGSRGENGEVSRIFARVIMPTSAEKVPAVVMMYDAKDIAHDEFKASSLARHGYAAIVVDYMGACGDQPFHTIYPPSVGGDYCAERLTEIPTSTRKNFWMNCAEVMLRGVTFAQSLDGVDASKIAILGEGVASSAVWKACVADDSIVTGITVFSSRFCPECKDGEDDTARLRYEAAFTDASYAVHVRVPMLVMCSSNEEDDSFDEICEAYSLIPASTNSRLSVSERCSHAIGYDQRNNILLWLDHHLYGIGKVPTPPQVKASCSDGRLYYEVKTEAHYRANLYVAQATQRPALRSWHTQKLVQTGIGEFISNVLVYDITKPVYAFANVEMDGFSVSSPLLSKIPAAMGVKVTPTQPARMIFDSEQGVADWMAYAPNSITPATLEEGPYGIEGVKAPKGALMTYRLSEKNFVGSENSILQISVYSAACQNLEFIITASVNKGGEERFVEFSAAMGVRPQDNWRKINLRSSEFVSAQGGSFSWTDVVKLKIQSESPVLIKTLLWI